MRQSRVTSARSSRCSLYLPYISPISPLYQARRASQLLRRKSTLNKISTTTGRRFLLDMGALMAQLQASTAHFVHCVKPNGMEQRELLSYEMVAEQLQP